MENNLKFFFSFILTITLFKATKCATKDLGDLRSKIFNGIEVDIEDVGYQLHILIEGRFSCGASLISPSWALTAAHCTNGQSNETLTLLGGSTSVGNGTSMQINTIVQHPNYDATTTINDISLLRFDPISFTETLYPIALPTTGQFFDEGTECVISGYGLTEEFVLPFRLLAANVTVSDQEKCVQNYGFMGICIARSIMICAAGTQGKDTCNGDSVRSFICNTFLPILESVFCYFSQGGPLVCNEVLTGITSFGIGCGIAWFPGIYTKVTSYRSWINEITGI